MRRSEQIQILCEVVARRRPELLPLAGRVGIETLTDEQLEMLSDVVSEEFCEVGLNEDSEPNSRGVILDDIMGFLVPYACNPKGNA